MVLTDYAAYLRQLLAANDTTQALQTAVDYVLESLGCEVSWAGIAAGENLVMGAHAGLQTSEMASAWQLGIGEGIGGRAALAGKPFMSNDYFHDSRRVPMKRLIDNERILATLVVPILVADRTLGVLYAAHRLPHPWASGEVDRLSEIAQDLAVKLRHLDLAGERADEARRSRTEAERAVAGLRSCGELAERIIAGHDVHSAVDALAAELDALVELRDADGSPVYSAGRAEAGGADALRPARDFPLEGDLELSVVTGRATDEADEAHAVLAIALTRLQLLRVGERERTTERLSGELLDQLLTGRIGDAESVRRRLTLLGLNHSQGTQLAVVASRGDEPTLSRRFQEALRATFRRCVTVEREGRLVVLFDLSECGAARTAERLAEIVSGERGGFPDLVVGLGRACDELIDYSMAYDEAKAACELAMRDDPSAAVVSARDLGLQGLASLPLVHLRKTVRDTLGPLLESDGGRGTDFVPTLQSYMRNDRHLPATAAELHVHYNTVRNRVARIEELLGVDMRDVDDRFRVETALRMHAVTRALGSHVTSG